jgi:uncharacterized repeat protein (TIGR01451 family)
MIFIFSSQGYEDIYVLKMSQKQIRGKVFLDASGDCIEDSGEYGLSGRLAEITPGNIIVQTDVNGYWFLDSLPAGTYNIDYDTSGNWMATCSPSSSFTISGSEFFYSVPSFGLKSGDPCAIPNVSIMIPTLRPCFTGQKIFVTVKNLETSTGLLVNSFVDITLDTMLTVTGANVPFTNLGNHIYRVNTGDLNLGEDSTFFFNVTLHCDALIGQTICAKAEVFPADDCIFDSIPSPFSGGVLPCTLPYDGSSIEVGSWCSNDTIYFSIANIGIGDMECYSPYLIYQDTQLIIQDSILLLSGEIDTLIFSGDGRTWRLEAQQHPLHPGNSNPNTTIELCGNQNNWTSGLVNLFPMDDANPNVDIFCVEASASYDPNDKTGYPLGITENNFIEPNQSMEYVIRFQNTGTDTAFTVVIRDTLDLDFDVFSVISGASSHSYAFRIYGPRVLEWTFSNIMLPDSTTDEPGSNGFVKFIVNQKTNLVPGTELNNEVGIYFDFNSPIITNTTSHIIHIPEDEPDFSGVENIALSFCDSIEVNGMYYSNPGMYYYSENDTLYMLDLQEGTLSVNIIQNGFVLSADIFGVSYRWLDCNNGYSIISGETNSSFTATVNGSYAVEVSENGCTDTSACFTISTIGVTENSFGENIRIYPNPSNGKLFIDLGRNTEKMNVSVKNAIGQIVYSETYQNKNILELNLNVERGIYFLELMSEEGSKKVIKFILE